VTLAHRRVAGDPSTRGVGVPAFLSVQATGVGRVAPTSLLMSPALSSVLHVGSVTTPSDDFRSVVLRGANVASYKSALAKSILTLAESGATAASLMDLAAPFSREILPAGRHPAVEHASPLSIPFFATRREAASIPVARVTGLRVDSLLHRIDGLA
jgi:hypothetical protein